MKEFSGSQAWRCSRREHPVAGGMLKSFVRSDSLLSPDASALTILSLLVNTNKGGNIFFTVVKQVHA
jgi:hypothetical protein